MRPNMQGVDWPKMRKLYEPLLPYVNHRADLTYVIGEMIGELNIGHAYVGGGDYPHPHRIRTGLLGAKIERDAASGYFRIQRILKGQNWDPRLRSPLTEIGVNVKEGDYILAVDGKPANKMPNLYAALVDTVGKQVTLRVNSRPQVERQPRGRGRSHRRRAPAVLPELGAAQHRAGFSGDRRQGGLRPHSRHDARRAQRVRQVLLPADAQGGPDPGRARQRGRQRLAGNHRAPPPPVGDDHRRPQRGDPHRSHGHDPRPEGDAVGRVLRFRRRYRGRAIPALQARAGGRQAFVGRSGRHPRHRSPCSTAATCFAPSSPATTWKGSGGSSRATGSIRTS